MHQKAQERLRAGKKVKAKPTLFTHCRSVLQQLVEEVRQKLSNPLMIARLDGGYLSGEILNTLVDMGLQICMSCRYDWVISQGVQIEESKWQPIDEMTRLYDVGKTKVISTSPHPFRVVLVEKKQTPFPGSKSKRKLFRKQKGLALSAWDF